MDRGVPEEQLWSWIDRDAPELTEYLAEHPEDLGRVEKMRELITGVAVTAAPPLPDRIGRYKIERLLGHGSMGAVYEAVQENPRRSVALKVVHTGLQTDKQILRYFHREAQLLARLSHPAIATVYEAGTTEAGEPFLAMQLARGRTLSKYLAQENPDRRNRLRVLQRIASAVHFAHENGVIHRDLKPSNVFVDEAGNPMVLDFGLARLAQPEAGSLWSQGPSSNLVGTLQYMSPEQAFGDLDEIDRRTDVYALGVMLYEALLGERPYDIENLPLPKAMERIKLATPNWDAEQRRDLGSDLQAILLRALEKDPARRYATAAAMADDIARYLDGKPIEARPPSLARRVGAHFVRHKAQALALILTIVGLAVGMGVGRSTKPNAPDIDLRSPLVGGRGASERAPFEAVRWQGDTPIVKHDGRWFEVESLAGHRIGLILEFCKQTGGPRWRMRFREDLVQVLGRMGPPPGDTVPMRVWDIENDETIEVPAAPMTKALREAAREASFRSAYTGFRCPAETPEVEYDGRWYRLRALDGVPFADLKRRAQQYDEHWKRYLVLSQVDLLTDILQRSPGDTVLLELVDPETGEERMIGNAPFTLDQARTLLAASDGQPEMQR